MTHDHDLAAAASPAPSVDAPAPAPLADPLAAGGPISHDPAGGSAAPDGATPRPPDSLAEYAMAAIRNDLLMGRLRPGERITAEAKAAELRISHIPVREAFRFLEAEGHVVRDGRRGVRIAPLSPEEAQDIYETRATLETEANRLGIPRLTDEDDARLAQFVQRMEQASRDGDLGAYRRSNRAFHFVAFERSGRPWLVRFLRILWDGATRYQSPLFTEGAWKSAHPSHHRTLFEALLCRDVEAVNAEMDHHRRWLLDRVGSQPKEATHHDERHGRDGTLA